MAESKGSKSSEAQNSSFELKLKLEFRVLSSARANPSCRQAELLPALPSISAVCVAQARRTECTCTRPSSRSASLISSASAPSVDGIVGRSHSPNFRPCFLPRHHADVTALVPLDGGASAPRPRRCGVRLGWLRYAEAQEQKHG